MDTYYLPDTHSPGKEVQDSLEKEILYGYSCRSQFRMKLKEDMVLLGPPRLWANTHQIKWDEPLRQMGFPSAFTTGLLSPI